MKVFTLIISMGAFLFLAGCSSISVTHDYDRDANFAALKTYDWASAQKNVVTPDAQSAAFQNQIIEKYIKRAVNSELEAKGLTMSATDPALLLAYYTGTQQKVNVTDYGYGYGYRGWGGGGMDVTQYTQGTIILDIIDAKTKQLIWRSVATGALASKPDPEQAEERIGEVMKQMLAEFPPEPKK
jgi:hypothetical protein